MVASIRTKELHTDGSHHGCSTRGECTLQVYAVLEVETDRSVEGVGTNRLTPQATGLRVDPLGNRPVLSADRQNSGPHCGVNLAWNIIGSRNEDCEQIMPDAVLFTF